MRRRRVAIVVRFRDEATWLGAVLEALRAQRGDADVEIVAADNASSDGSRRLADEYADRVLEIHDYRPGAALNRAIGETSCDTIVVLSAHALPADEGWLRSLLGGLDDPGALAAYGTQVYPLTARFLDKRDLDIFCHPQPRRELRDSDFWNANSAFERNVWERRAFDETVFELEDHYWTKCQLPAPGAFVRYEPRAAVYHYGHESRNDRTFLSPEHPGDAEAIARAIRTLDDADATWPEVMAAGLTLGSLSHVPSVRRAVPAMGRRLLEHSDFDVRWRMAHALGRIGAAEAVPFLALSLRDESFYARDEATWSLARIGSAAVPAVLGMLNELEPEHVPFAALALGLSGDRSGERRAFELLEESLAAEDAGVERDALYFLGELAAVPGAGALLPAVCERLFAADADIARPAAWCWGKLVELEAVRPAGVADCVTLASDHDDGTVRAEAAIALGRLARATASATLLDALDERLGVEPFGRARYGIMQTLRLAAEAGSEHAAAIAHGHDVDDDFGVRFERALVLSGAPSVDRV